MPDANDDLIMLQEIREQPAVLTRVLANCASVVSQITNSQSPKTLHLIGCGDMHFAAMQTAALAELLWGLPARAWQSMDLRWAHRLFTKDDLVVCASISGRTPRTIEAAKLVLQTDATVVAITDNPDSRLHKTVEQTIILGTSPVEELTNKSYAGYRNIIAQTQTFSSVLMVELMLAAKLAGADADMTRMPECFSELIDRFDKPVEQIAEDFFQPGCIIVILGSGPHYPAACFGAAKMLEFAIPAAAQCIEEYHHLESFLADANTRIIVLAGDEESAHRAVEVTAAWDDVSAKSMVLSAGYGLRDVPFPGKNTQTLQLPGKDLLDAVIAEIVVLQLLTAHGVAHMGRDPNRWLGGHRTDLIQGMSTKAIRGSNLWANRQSD